MTEYNSYNVFVNSLDNDFSIKKEFKKDIKMLFDK